MHQKEESGGGCELRRGGMIDGLVGVCGDAVLVASIFSVKLGTRILC